MTSRVRAPWLAALTTVLGIFTAHLAWAQESPPAKPSPVDPLMQQVNAAIEISSRRYLDADNHTPWQIIHGVLALRKDYLIKDGDEKVSALEWISNGATYKGTPYFEVTRWGGRAQPFSKPYIFEGHPNQFLGYMSMSNLPLDHEIQTPTRPITIGDVVKNAQMEVQAGEEPAWTLWGLVHYLGPDATWQNKNGEPWSIERLVRSQTYEPVNTAACGGTHGLFALSYARNTYLESGERLRGAWLEADQKIRRYVEEARSLQNSDGSFSASFFQGRRYEPDVTKRVGPSGHTLEFVIMALPPERLNETWVRNGVDSVSKDLIECRSQPLDCGPLYHALSSLVIYRERMAALAQSSQVAESSAAPVPGSDAAP